MRAGIRIKPPPTPRKPESQPVKKKTPVTVQNEMVIPEAGKCIMGGRFQAERAGAVAPARAASAIFFAWAAARLSLVI
jgi:hypothetical protein